jgi:DNA-damage-inducible protein D
MRNGAMVGLGSGSTRELEGVALTRYACYLIAQNGDAAKPEIANFEGTCG